MFPSWFLQQALLFVLSLTERDGPIMSLRTMRKRKGSDEVFRYTETGDLVRLQRLFAHKEASPFDLDGNTDISILTVRTESKFTDVSIEEF